MQIKNKLLYGYIYFAIIENVNTWCICQEDKQQEFTVTNKEDLNKLYVNSDDFRNKNSDQRLPQLKQRDAIEHLPDEYVGHDPLKYHVEANYDEDPTFLRNNLKIHTPPRIKRPMSDSHNKPFPINPNWKPRNTAKRPTKNKASKWLPMKIPPIFTKPFKNWPEYLKPPWMPKKFPTFHIFPPKKSRINQNEVSEEEDFTSREMLNFMHKHGINHIIKWSLNSDPEQGFKHVKVVLPKQIWNDKN